MASVVATRPELKLRNLQTALPNNWVSRIQSTAPKGCNSIQNAAPIGTLCSTSPLFAWLTCNLVFTFGVVINALTGPAQSPDGAHDGAPTVRGCPVPVCLHIAIESMKYDAILTRECSPFALDRPQLEAR